MVSLGSKIQVSSFIAQRWRLTAEILTENIKCIAYMRCMRK